MASTAQRGAERGAGAEPETHVFADDGVFPNSRLPVLIYRGVLATPNAGGAGLDPGAARTALRTCLLRLRLADVDGSIRDGRLLLDQAQRDDDPALLQQVETQLSLLGREKAGISAELAIPSGVSASAGARRN